MAARIDPLRKFVLCAVVAALVWRPAAGVSTAGFLLPQRTRVTADFSTNRTGKVAVNVPVKIDLSGHEGIAFDFTAGDLAQFGSFCAYLKSGKGWYRVPFTPEKTNGVERILILKEMARPEDGPSGWDGLSTFRVSARRCGTKDTYFEMDRFSVVDKDDVVRFRAGLDRTVRPCTMPKGEFRAFWCHSPRGIDGKRSWDESVAIIKRCGFNVLIANLAWAGTAYYRSSALPVSPTVETEGDAFDACLAACRKHGVALHVWKLTWNTGWGAETRAFRQEMEKAGRTMVLGKDEKYVRWLCPSHPENRRLAVESMVELARKGADGVHFDYIRYNGVKSCRCEGCRRRFEKRIGRSVARWPRDIQYDGPDAAEWRRFRVENINAVVREASERIRREYPGTAISAAVFPDCETTADEIGQDWASWCREGIVDFVCPMNYVSSAVAQGAMIRQQLQATAGGKAKLYPGIGLTTFPDDGCEARRFVEQIECTRRAGTGGFVAYCLTPRAEKALSAIKWIVQQ